MKKAIFISTSAERDLQKAIHYIRLDRPLAAEKFKALLQNKIKSLEVFSERGRRIPELKSTLWSDCRELILNPYRILYKINERDIRILRILHSKKLFRLF